MITRKWTAVEVGLSLASINNSVATSNIIDMTVMSYIGVVAVIASAGAPTGVVTIQGSNDGTNWVTFATAAYTTSTGAFAPDTSAKVFPFCLARITVSETATVAATATVVVMTKGPE